MFCLHALCVCIAFGGKPEAHGTGILDSRELPRGCWEWNPGSLEEQAML